MRLTVDLKTGTRIFASKSGYHEVGHGTSLAMGFRRENCNSMRTVAEAAEKPSLPVTPQPDVMQVCILDDQASHIELLAEQVRALGFEPAGTTQPGEAMRAIRSGKCRVALVDLRMPELDGMEFMEQALAIDPGLYVVLVTGEYSLDSAVEAIHRGAFDYIAKPVELKRLQRTLEQVQKLLERQQRTRDLEQELLANFEFHGIIGRSPVMLDVFDLIRKVAPHFSNILITGPTGAGKELVAQALHEMSPAASKRFAVCNCSALVDTLLESQLFGHMRGSFTGATDSRAGLFEYANGGTVFLDEIAETSPPMQAKLLRVIQNREIQRIGSPEVKLVDVRLIAATNRDLQAEAAVGRFRQDLYYRLSMLHIAVPALAERQEDIPLLCQHFLNRANKAYNKSIKGLTRRAQTLLRRHAWPGNIRELENVISSAAMLATGEFIDVADLPPNLRLCERRSNLPENGDWEPLSLDAVKRRHIERTLAHCNGNRVRAAELLGIGRTSLYRFLQSSGEKKTLP
jgi:DNA-binding NtrC family response regulator